MTTPTSPTVQHSEMHKDRTSSEEAAIVPGGVRNTFAVAMHNAFAEAMYGVSTIAMSFERQTGKTLYAEQHIIAPHLQAGRAVYMADAKGGGYTLRMDDPCDEFDHERIRPAEPTLTNHVWYRGWEVGFSHDSAYWCGEGWIAYKGGCDLDAPEVRAKTYAGCLDEIDEQEDE